ncbi:MAG: ribonuclease Z, partial [Candidatus Thorarchaeota archaeon]
MYKDYESHWANDEVQVDIPFSAAGVATTIVLTSKFTGKMMLFDVGDGILRDLLMSGNTDFVHEIDPIAISHGHFDHVGGLHSLL